MNTHNVTNTKIVPGPNSKTTGITIVNPLEEAVSKALKTDYTVSTTDMETLAITAERTGNDKLLGDVQTLQNSIQSIQDLQTKVRGDLTRSNSEKLHLLNKNSKTMFDNIDKTISEIDKQAVNLATKAKQGLFSTSRELTVMEQALLPLFASELSKDESQISISNVTESEGKLLLNILQFYPTLVNSKQFERNDLADVRRDLDERFSPEEFKTVVGALDVRQSIKSSVKSLSDAKHGILPSETIEKLNSSRV